MRASVHVADVGVRSALTLTRKPPPPGSIAGLRTAEVGIAAPLGSSLLPKPQFGRAALIGSGSGRTAKMIARITVKVTRTRLIRPSLTMARPGPV